MLRLTMMMMMSSRETSRRSLAQAWADIFHLMCKVWCSNMWCSPDRWVTSFSCLRRLLLKSASSACCSLQSVLNSRQRWGLMLIPVKTCLSILLKITSRDLGRMPASASGPEMTRTRVSFALIPYYYFHISAIIKISTDGQNHKPQEPHQPQL